MQLNENNLNGMLWRRTTVTNTETGLITTEEGWFPGRILEQWRQLISQTDPLQRKKKEGVRFLVRSAEDLVDQLRAVTNALGIIIYPGVGTKGEGKVVEDGTLADVNMVLIAQSVEDGSMLAFGGYGQGADPQDKAGGKAMTYAHKAIMVQAAMMGGTKTAKALGIRDTDDSDTPIKGGVKPAPKDSLKAVRKALSECTEPAHYEELRPQLRELDPKQQTELKADIDAAKAVSGWVAGWDKK